MRELTDREKRTLIIASVAIAIYLGLFYGVRGWKELEATRLDYLRLVAEAERANRTVRAAENRLLVLENLKETLRIDPGALSRNTVVADASAAMQQAAQAANIDLGPVREGPGSPASGELATMQVEAVGQVAAVLAFVHRLEALGFPSIIESLQVTPESNRPGSVKLNVRIVILDFDHWKTREEDAGARTL